MEKIYGGQALFSADTIVSKIERSIRMKKMMITAICGVLALSSCGSTSADSGIDSGSTRDRREVTESVTASPVQVKFYDNYPRGYGQGLETDGKNRPTGALDFNAKYGKYDADAIDEKGKKIRLTFDQGYENGYTEKILDTLKEKKVKAVFFLVQDYAERNPEIVKRMIKEGHIIGNHSVTHRSMPTLSPEEMQEEINGLNSYLKEKFGVEPELFRPPMGEYSELSLAVTKQCGCRTMLWSFAYADWDVDDQPEPSAALERLTGAAHEGAIYLLHSVSSTNAEILGDFIDSAREKGFEFY